MKEIEIFLRKLILNIYLLFKKPILQKSKLDIAGTDKILLIRLNKIGDALVTTPFIKYLKENKKCSIHVLSDHKNSFIFENDTNVDQVFVFPKRGREIKELRKKINGNNYKAVFDLHDDVSTTVSLFLGSLNIPNKIGFAKKNKKLFSHVIPYPDPTKYHVVERYLQFFDFLNLPYSKDSVRINYLTKSGSTKEIEDFINGTFEKEKYIVGINISAGSDARFWGIDRYKKLIAYFSEYHVNLIVLSSPNDEMKARAITGNKIPLFIDPDFDKFAAMINKLNFLFTPDTSVVHLASAFNIPMFGIYVKYNTQNVVWYPYNTQHDLIVIEEPNFENLEFDSVINKLKIFFEHIYNGKRNS